MRLFKYKDREKVKCPTREASCIGEQCSCFNRWYDWYEKKIVLSEYKHPWWAFFLFTYPFVLARAKRQFDAWEPPEVEGWEFYDKEFYEWGDIYPRAKYRRLNENRRFSCGLNCENK